MTNNIVATATATVVNGRAETSNIHYEEQLIPGMSYYINAEYLENNTYKRSTSTGTLEINKIPTTIIISGNNNITLGETVTLNISITEEKNNSNLSRGTVAIYDGNNIIQSNHAVTGNNTTISFIPSTVGAHDIYAVYNDTGIEYNSSNSNHINVTVNKKSSSITAQSNLQFYFGDGVIINGTLTSGNINLSGMNVKLVDYDGVTIQNTTSDSNGVYSFSYNPQNWNVHGNNIMIVFDGTNEYDSNTKSIPVTLLRHNVTITVPDLEGYVDDNIDIPITLVDENEDNITSGEVNVDLVLVESSPVLTPIHVDSSLQDKIYLKFDSAESDGDSLTIFCELVDENGETPTIDGYPAIHATTSLNEIYFQCYNEVSMTITDDTDGYLSLIYYEGRPIYINIAFEDIEILNGISVDTDNQTVTLEGTFTIRGETNTTNWSLTGQYTEVTEDE